MQAVADVETTGRRFNWPASYPAKRSIGSAASIATREKMLVKLGAEQLVFVFHGVAARAGRNEASFTQRSQPAQKNAPKERLNYG